MFFCFAAQVREPGMQWSFANNVSGPSQYLSFRTSQEARPRKIIDDWLDSNQMFGANGTRVSFPIKKCLKSCFAVQWMSGKYLSVLHDWSSISCFNRRSWWLTNQPGPTTRYQPTLCITSALIQSVSPMRWGCLLQLINQTKPSVLQWALLLFTLIFPQSQWVHSRSEEFQSCLLFRFLHLHVLLLVPPILGKSNFLPQEYWFCLVQVNREKFTSFLLSLLFFPFK